MESFEALLKAFTETPTPAMLVLSLLANGWQFRDSRQRDREHAANLAAANTAHLATATQHAATQAQMLQGIDVLSRLAERSR